MSRFDHRALKTDEKQRMLDELAQIFSNLDTQEATRYFLSRLLTESEVVMLRRRFAVAELLVGGLTYDQVRKKLGVGPSTIRDVDKWLTDAAHEYNLIREYNRKEKQRKARVKRKGQKRTPTTIPGTIEHLIQHDSRLILVKLLMGK